MAGPEFIPAHRGPAPHRRYLSGHTFVMSAHCLKKGDVTPAEARVQNFQCRKKLRAVNNLFSKMVLPGWFLSTGFHKYGRRFSHVTPAKAGVQKSWIPASAGMTNDDSDE